jgi:DNA-binding NarL/FixJ family response regulator
VDKIRAGIFDDHTFSAKGLSDFLVNKGIEVRLICTSKSDLIDKLKSAELDILILDIAAPDVAGLELFEYCALKHKDIRLIALTSLSSVMLVENLLSIGIKGFVNKKQKEEDILECVRRVHNNEICLPKEYHFLISKYRVASPVNLSAREVEIIQLISQQFTSQEIAVKLSISFFTVENHRKNIFKKMGVKNIAGMIMAAKNMGHIS